MIESGVDKIINEVWKKNSLDINHYLYDNENTPVLVMVEEMFKESVNEILKRTNKTN